MSKQEFLSRLLQALSGLPEDDVAERIAFYSESIDDRIEEGMSEEEAVACVGSVEEIRAQVLSEILLPKLVKEKVKPNGSSSIFGNTDSAKKLAQLFFSMAFSRPVSRYSPF